MIEASARPLPPRVSARLALASMIGTSLEWYDFMIYNTAAALVFSSVFFPASAPLAGLLLAFSTYAVGYLSRPFGSLIFGRLGDLLGRRSTLVLTLVLMGVGTSLIAVLPTYHEIGILSPALLVASRLLQGIALGGEWAGAVLLAMEHGGAERRGLNSSWAQMRPAAGTLLSSGVIALLTFVLSDKQFMAWGRCDPTVGSADSAILSRV
jgi:MFS family permease